MVDPQVLHEFEMLTAEIKEAAMNLAKMRARQAELRTLIVDGKQVGEAASERKVSAWDRIRDPNNYDELLAEPRQPSKALIEVARIVRDLGGKATNAQVAKELMVSNNVAALRLRRATKAGLLIRLRVGVYALAVPKQTKRR